MPLRISLYPVEIFEYTVYAAILRLSLPGLKALSLKALDDEKFRRKMRLTPIKDETKLEEANIKIVRFMN